MHNALDEPLITFPGAAHIPYAQVTRHVWGDTEAGEVSDWTYLSTEYLTQLLFGMPPGAVFRHSENFKTIFAADELYFVVSGDLVLANPETGEMVRARRGEAIFFQRDTWHHGFNISNEPLRVVEYFAPPPSQGAGAAYARQQPNLKTVQYCKDNLLAHWIPPHSVTGKQTLCPVREGDALVRLEGNGSEGMTHVLVSTEQMTVGTMDLMPGQHTGTQAHGGDEGVFVLEGTAQIRIVESNAPNLFELAPYDGAYIPMNTAHQYLNWSNQPVRILFGISPHYLPQTRS